MISEGKLIIDLGTPVRIVSNRTASVAGLLKGRAAHEALALLPLVFSLCAHAHTGAARLATGLGPADMRLVLAENAREHLLRIMLGWKGDDIAEIPAKPVMALVPDTAAAIKDGNLEPVATGLETFLKTYVFGCKPDEFLQMDAAQWLADTQTRPAAYLRGIKAKNWQDLGAVPALSLPEMQRDILLERLQMDGFCACPDWQGTPRETGPFARQKNHPLVLSQGAGLLARLLARLVELAQIPAQLRAAMPLEMPAGLGVIETARGRLIHMARMENGLIADYKILAPTEWNFHPDGVASQALAGLVPDQARALVEAIDPCVDFEVRAA